MGSPDLIDPYLARFRASDRELDLCRGRGAEQAEVSVFARPDRIATCLWHVRRPMRLAPVIDQTELRADFVKFVVKAIPLEKSETRPRYRVRFDD